jgi:hypothetical protein
MSRSERLLGLAGVAAFALALAFPNVVNGLVRVLIVAAGRLAELPRVQIGVEDVLWVLGIGAAAGALIGVVFQITVVRPAERAAEQRSRSQQP